MGVPALSEFDLTLYHCHLTRSARVQWASFEMDIPINIKDVNLMEGEQYEPEFRSQNPMSVVPTLHFKHRTTERELTMTESGAIVAFLSEQTGKLGPGSDIFAQAQYHRFCVFATDSMDSLLWIIRRNEDLFPDGERTQFHVDTARKEFISKVVPTLEKELGDGTKWLCAPYCEDFTAADLLVGYSLFWASMYGLLDDSAILTNYLKRIMARESFVRALGERDAMRAQLKKLRLGAVRGEWLPQI